MTPLRRGWLHLAGGAGVGRILGFGSNLLLSRWLGPTELGLFNLLTTTIQTSETLARCGGDYALNYELGGKSQALQTEQGRELARAFVQICTLTTILICIVVSIWIWNFHGLFPYSMENRQRVSMTLLLLLMIACEVSCASGWEMLLVSNRTLQLALKNGLFYPLRLLSAALGSLVAGALGAMFGWSFISLLQCFWMRRVLRDLWNPFRIFPLLSNRIRTLLTKGLTFYGANLVASSIFYGLLIKVANASGLAEIGYLRVGQILQQFFAFLPSTLVPILFLELRSQSSFRGQVLLVEKPLRIIWFLLLQILLLYCLFDHIIIQWLFGNSFGMALIPTRLLLVTALFESLAQLLVQPLLATGKISFYGILQNISAIVAAFLGWLWIPSAGLAAYLVVRLIYVIVPLIGFGIPVVRELHEPRKIVILAISSFCLMSVSLYQIVTDQPLLSATPVFITAFFVLLVFHRHDFLFLKQLIRISV